MASKLAEDQPKEAFTVLNDALCVAAGCGILLAATLAVVSPAVLGAICSQAPILVPTSLKYLRIRLIGLPLAITSTVLQARSTFALSCASILPAAGTLRSRSPAGIFGKPPIHLLYI